MEIVLYKFNKKVNSTAVPSSSDESLTLTCQVKTPSSIITPTVQLAKTTSPIGYNYTFIPDWGRYYFIQDITYALGVWVLSLSVDVLASFRSQILNSSQYVLRSASESDGAVIDHNYPTKASSTKGLSYGGNVTINAGSPVSGYFDGILLTGCYVIQVYSDNSSGVTAYALNQAAFNSLLSNLMSYVPSDMDDVSAGVAKQLWDPLQYIVSVQWFPAFPDKDAGTSRSSINFGGYPISVSGTCKSFDPTAWDRMFCDISVPKHPDASVHPYMQLTPFSNYRLYFEPFGTIELDTTKLYGVNTIRCNWYLEYQKGLAHLTVTDASASTNVIATADAVFGVDIPIAQLTSDYIGAGSSMFEGAARATANLVTGNIFGAVGNVVSSIGQGVASMLPNMTGRGTPGSFLIFRGESPRIEYQLMDIVGRDPDRFGEPLCQIRTLSSLDGFTVCSDASIESPATAAERSRIELFLNSGVFLE